jgi:cell division protein ZapA
VAHVTIRINGRPYEIGCEDGQEDHLQRLSEYVDRRVRELVGSVGQVEQARLLVMASLLIADELSEATARLGEGTDAAASAQAVGETVERLRLETEAAAAQRLERAAESLESLAARLEAE